MPNPIPLRLNDANMLQLIRKISTNTKDVFLSPHAKRRMRERRITMPQVYACLRQGAIHERAHEDIGGDWKCTLVHRYAGDEVHVAVAVKREPNDEWIVIVTVF